MRKLTLNLDQLAIESFDTSATRENRGTVVGEEQSGSCFPCDSVDYYTCGPTPGYRTCDASATAGGGLCECCVV